MQRWSLLGLFAFSQAPTVYSLPGTSHAIVLEQPLDAFRQQSLQQTVISNAVSGFDKVAAHSTSDDASSHLMLPFQILHIAAQLLLGRHWSQSFHH